MNYYIFVVQTGSSELTNGDRIATSIVAFMGLVLLVALVLAALDIPGQIDNRKYEKNRDEQQILSAIANASEKTADIFQPGATVADIVVATNLPVSRVLRIVKKFKRNEIVKEGQNENGNKIYFV